MCNYIAGRKLVVAGAGLMLATLLAGPVLAEPDEAAIIEKRLEQYESRFNQGDAEALSRLFSENVVYYGPLGRVFEGRAAVRQHYQDNMTAGFSDMTVEAIEIEILDDTAYDVARYTITGPKGRVFEGYHLAILEKQDGEWIVQRTLVNAVMPKPPGE